MYALHRARLADPLLNERLLKMFAPLIRPRERQKLPGAFWFVAGFLASRVLYSRSIATLSLLCTTFGDPAASLVGQIVQQRAPSYAFRLPHGKTTAGFMACVVTCFIALFMALFTSSEMAVSSALAIALVAGLAAGLWLFDPSFCHALTSCGCNHLVILVTHAGIAEVFPWPAGVDDNFAIPVVTGFVLQSLQATSIWAAVPVN